MPTIKIECQSCRGTGLYSGFCEAPGEAVVCSYCEGSGWSNYSYKEFVGRKKKRGIKTIKYSSGTFIVTGVGGHGNSMTYAQFEARHPDA